MQSLGIEHGKKGFSRLTEDVRAVCMNNDKTVSLERYETGFNMGWSAYCTSFNGFEMGRKGDNYKSFCPPEKESLFHEKFLIGKTVYEKKDEVEELEEKIKDLNSIADKDMATKDELRKNQELLLSLKRDIQVLEQKGVSLIHTN